MGGWGAPARPLADLRPWLGGGSADGRLGGSRPPTRGFLGSDPEPVRSPILLTMGDEIDEEIMRRYFGPLGTREEGCPNLAAGVGAFSGGSLPPETAPPLPGGSRPHFSRSRLESGWEPPARTFPEVGCRAAGSLPPAHTPPSLRWEAPWARAYGVESLTPLREIAFSRYRIFQRRPAALNAAYSQFSHHPRRRGQRV